GGSCLFRGLEGLGGGGSRLAGARRTQEGKSSKGNPAPHAGRIPKHANFIHRSEPEFGFLEERTVVVGREGLVASLLPIHQAEDGGDFQSRFLGGTDGIERRAAAGDHVLEDSDARAGGGRVLDQPAGAVGLDVLANQKGRDRLSLGKG